MRTSNYDFKKDLVVAHSTENQVVEYLVNNQDMSYITRVDTDPNAKLSDYDIKMMINKTGKQVTIEIKEDFICRRTGNVGVEYECRGKLSGISISKADFYLYKIHLPQDKIGIFITSTNILKKIIKDKEYFRIVNGGDPGSNSMNYLFKLEVVKKYFKLLAYVEK